MRMVCLIEKIRNCDFVKDNGFSVYTIDNTFLKDLNSYENHFNVVLAKGAIRIGIGVTTDGNANAIKTYNLPMINMLDINNG